jgi:hypothetical protein
LGIRRAYVVSLRRPYAAQMCGTVQRRLTSLVRDQLAKWRNVSLQENKNSDQAS